MGENWNWVSRMGCPKKGLIVIFKGDIAVGLKKFRVSNEIRAWRFK